MQVFLAQVINALVLGNIYALLVTGFNLILLVGGIFNAAYPHTVVMSMYICWMVLEATGNNIPLAIVAAVSSAVGMSLISERILRPLVRQHALVISFVVTLGMTMIFSDIMGRQLNKGLTIGFSRSFTGKEALISHGLTSVTVGQFLTVVGAITSMLILSWLLYHTKQGISLRVAAQEPVVARILGIPIAKTTILSWGIAGLLAGISAIFLAMALGWASGALPGDLWIKILAIALFAGLGNLRGGLYGALILAFGETMVLAYLPGDWSEAISFAMIIIAVGFKPQGLFGVKI